MPHAPNRFAPPAPPVAAVTPGARRAGPVRPLQGLTVLAVEDSRFASEALRLLCLRLGARIRRAESLAAADRHLATYRPDLAIIDLGLPDGCGTTLIRQLAQADPRVSAILGLSGMDDGRAAALAAGADGFMAKPIPSLAAFLEAVRDLLPGDLRPTDPAAPAPPPDPLALRDDLTHAAALLGDPGTSGDDLDYVAGFIAGLARLSDDPALAEAAAALLHDRREAHRWTTQRMLHDRLISKPML